MQTVAIVGCGLIGASFGLALKAAGFAGRIVGVSSPGAIDAAIGRGAIDAALPLDQAAAQADLILLAQPIGRILDTLYHLDAHLQPHALVTDAGSTKSAIMAHAHKAIRRAQFLGGHPMAGKETRGAAEADANLFADRTWVLTPCAPEELETESAREFLSWLARIGAHPVVVGPDEHDHIVAFTSHLPQLLSTALAATVSENLEEEDHLSLSGPGLLDATRLALSSYELWRDILSTNCEPVEAALGACIQKLEHLRENLRSRQLQQEFETGAELAARLRRL